MAPIGRKRKQLGPSKAAQVSKIGARELREVMPLSEMVPGLYEAWECRACRKPIALVARRDPGGATLDLGDIVLKLHCPHCSTPGSYAVHERRMMDWKGIG